MTRSNNNHRRALEKIANHPDKFNIPSERDGVHSPIVSAAIEQNLYHNGRLIAQPDVTFETASGEVYIVEFKGYGKREGGNGNGDLFARARKQLEQAKWWYGSHKSYISPDQIHTVIIAGDDDRYRDLLRNMGHDD